MKNNNEDKKKTYDERRAAIRAQKLERMTRDREFLLCSIVAQPKYGKSGLAMDCRTEKEIENGMIVRYLDLDDGATPTWDAAWDRDENIDIYVPNELRKDGSYDWDETLENCIVWLDETKEMIAEGKVKAVVLDGMDKVYDGSGDIMRESLVNMKQGKKGIIRDTIRLVVKPFQWKIRNDVYLKIQNLFMALNAHRFIITHFKPIYDSANLSDGPSRWEPDWHKNTPQRMLQMIEIQKLKRGKTTDYVAELVSCKTNSDAVGRTWTIFRVHEDKPNEWFGIPDIKNGKFNGDEEE
jgi:hypothetical protein